MKINKNNYEEFFLLYADSELTAEERTMVENFVALHPELNEELEIISQTKLPIEEGLIYTDKSGLFKHTETTLVNENNYSEYFLLYVDDELNAEEKKSVEAFAAANKNKQAELLLLQRVKLQPEEDIVFTNKNILHRSEKKPIRIAYMRWVRVAAAAAVILTGIAVWTNMNNEEPITENNEQPAIAKNTTVKENSNQEKQVEQQTTTTPVESVSTPEAAIDKVDNNKTTEKPERIVERTAAKNAEHVTTNMQKASIEEQSKTNTTDITANEHVAEPLNNKPVVPDITTSQIAANNATRPSRGVKPLILDAAAFNGQNKTSYENQAAFLDTDNTDTKPKGKLRGLFRKASRIIDHVTNADEANDQSVVRIASFEIAKK